MSDKVRELIKLIALDGLPIQNVICTVDSVNKGNATCSATPLNGDAQFLNVRLKALVDNEQTGIIVYPKPGTTIVVGLLEGKDVMPFMVMASEFESVLIALQTGFKMEIKQDGTATLDAEEFVFNGGGLGGLVIIAELVNKMNRLENSHNALSAKFNIHTHPTTCGAGAGTATVTPNQDASNITPLTTTNDLENPKIKH